MKVSLHILICSFFIFIWAGCSPKTTNNVSEKQESSAVNSKKIWKDTDPTFTNRECPGKIFPTSYRMLDVDTAMMRHLLIIQGNKPGEISTDTILIDIPLPDESWEEFRITQVQVMAPELAAKYPYIKTYSGYAKLYPADQIRLEVSPEGIRAMILSSRGTVLIDPFCKEDKLHMISFFKKNLPEGAKQDFEK